MAKDNTKLETTNGAVIESLEATKKDIKVKFDFNALENGTLRHSHAGKRIEHHKSVQKAQNGIILEQCLHILRDKENYSQILNDNNPDFAGINSAYRKITSLYTDHDLHKSTDKIIKTICHTLRYNSKVDFSMFVKTFKDLDNFNKFSFTAGGESVSWFNKEHLENHEKFSGRVSELNTVFQLQKDLQNDKVFVPKQKRKFLGEYALLINNGYREAVIKEQLSIIDNTLVVYKSYIKDKEATKEATKEANKRANKRANDERLDAKKDYIKTYEGYKVINFIELLKNYKITPEHFDISAMNEIQRGVNLALKAYYADE